MPARNGTALVPSMKGDAILAFAELQISNNIRDIMRTVNEDIFFMSYFFYS